MSSNVYRSSISTSLFSSSSAGLTSSGCNHRRSFVVVLSQERDDERNRSAGFSSTEDRIFEFIDPEEVAPRHLATKRPRDESTSANEPALKIFTVRSHSKTFCKYMPTCLQPSDARLNRKRYEPDFLKKSVFSVLRLNIPWLEE